MFKKVSLPQIGCLGLSLALILVPVFIFNLSVGLCSVAPYLLELQKRFRERVSSDLLCAHPLLPLWETVTSRR